MYQISAQSLVDKFMKAHQYQRELFDEHEDGHVFGGLPGGPNFMAMFGHTPLSEPVTSGYIQKLLKNPLSRPELIELLKTNPGLNQRMRSKRLENMVGFLQDNTTKEITKKAAFVGELPSHYRSYVDVPFFAHELCMLTHTSHLNVKICGHSPKTRTASIAKTSGQLDVMFDIAHAYKETADLEHILPYDENHDCAIMYGIEPNIHYSKNPKGYEESGSGVAHMKDDVHLMTMRPLIYKQPFPHMIFGWDVHVALAKIPKAATTNPQLLPSFDICMSEFYRKQWQAVYVDNTNEYLQSYKENKSLLVDSPYEKDKTYHANIGLYDVFTVPDESIVASTHINCESFIHAFEKDPKNLISRIKMDLEL